MKIYFIVGVLTLLVFISTVLICTSKQLEAENVEYGSVCALIFSLPYIT